MKVHQEGNNEYPELYFIDRLNYKLTYPECLTISVVSEPPLDGLIYPKEENI